MAGGEKQRTSRWTDLCRAKPHGAGWIAWFMVYCTVHAIADLGGFTMVHMAGAPRDLVFGVIAISVLMGFLAAQAATLLANELLRRLQGQAPSRPEE